MDYVNVLEYPCSQVDLHSVLETAWGNNGVHLARFTSFKALYTLPYKASALAAIASARAMPDDDARSGAGELLHVNVVNLGEVCLHNFQFLKRYIDTAFADPKVREIQYGVAGQEYYKKASRKDWVQMLGLNSSSKNFLAIPANVTALIANNNMPAGFVTVHKLACDNFEAQYAAFKLAEETSVETTAKIDANNACYRTGISMMKDAQAIFKNEPEILTKFVFKNLLGLINPPVAGIKGKVKEAVTNAVIDTVTVSAQLLDKPVISVAVDEKGDFSEQLEAGQYVIRIGAARHVEQVFELDLALTGLKTLNVDLVKVV